MTKLYSRKTASLKVLTVALASLCTLGSMPCLKASAEVASGKSSLSNAQLTALVRDSSVGARALSVTVVGTGPTVTVLAEEKETAIDKDLKIDALFLARTLIEGAPGQIEKVKVLFSQTGKPARHIMVSRGEITDFSAGRLSAAALLESLTFSSAQSLNMPEIAEGPEMARSMLVWKRIENLSAQGTGVSPFVAIFKEIQALAKANDIDKSSERLTYLESKLIGQEQQVKQAKESLRGRGVPAVRTAASTGAGGTPPGGAAAGATPGQGAAGGYIPPEAEHLKAVFNAQGNEIISQVTRKNSSEGYRLRDMKAEIEKLFASRQDAKAFEMLHSFDLAATKVLGTSAFGPGGQGGQGGGQGPGQGGQGPGGGMGPGGGGPPGGGMGPGGGGMGPGGGPPF